MNTKLKASKTPEGECAYPVYIRILHRRILSRINSVAVNVPVTEKQFENLYNSGIKHKLVTETEGTEMKNGMITETRETITEHVNYDIRKAVETETNIITSFFDFASRHISDFIISKAKTNFGDLLDYYANTEITQLLEWSKTDFIPFETRLNLHTKLRQYIEDKTGFTTSTAIAIAPVNVGLHSKSRNGKREFIHLGTEMINDFLMVGILTDKEAGLFEFINLLQSYDFETYRLPFARKGKQAERKKRINNPYEYLTLRVWLREKPAILKYLTAKASPKTREFIAEYAEKSEKVFIDLFKKQYFEGLRGGE
ncbi:MAG: hypothetical protein LBD59_04040 [Prevotellaceae bacterium]|nr:hypothetical protein [Prevotellaceae bacterium]